MLKRPVLKELRVITSIHHLLMKFLMPNGIGQVCGCQSEARECYNRSLGTAEKDKNRELTLIVSDQGPASSGPMSKDLDPRQLEDE